MEPRQAILVVSFGTSYNDSREKTIGAVERAVAEAFPAYEVRRAFTSQRIIDKLFSGLYESSAHIYFLLISVWYDSGAFGARVSVYNTKKRLSTSFCDFFSGNFYTSQNLLNPLKISRFLKSYF